MFSRRRIAAAAAMVAPAASAQFATAGRAGQPAPQFVTLVYDFKGGEPAKPYVPRPIF